MSILDNVSEFLSEYSLPITLGGQVASVALKARAEKKARAEREALIAAEQARQAEIGERGSAAFRGVAPKFTPQVVNTRRQQEEQRLQAVYAPSSMPSSVVGNYQETVNENLPVAAGGDLTQKVGAALSEARANANRLALARSFGNTQQNDQATMADAGREVSRAGRDARSSAEVLPLELDTAALEAKRRRALPEMLGVATGIAGLYGASRARKPAPLPDQWWGTTERNF